MLTRNKKKMGIKMMNGFSRVSMIKVEKARPRKDMFGRWKRRELSIRSHPEEHSGL